MSDNPGMSEQEPGQVEPGKPSPEPSPWSREYATQDYQPRFAQPYTGYPPPPPAPPAYYPPPLPERSSAGESQYASEPPSRAKRTGVWVLVGILALVLIGGAAAIFAVDYNDPSAAPEPIPGSGLFPGPNTGPNSPNASPTPSPSASSGLPPVGLIATPPALLAIGYHAYSSMLLDPNAIALGPQELVQFKKYGLSRTVSMQALTLGSSANTEDDYTATINVLKFKDAAGAKAELDYSNSQNEKTAPTVPLPGLPDATGFFNKADATSGISVGAFATTGRYQVVIILSGLPENESTSESAFLAETARVMKAVLPIAATIEPETATGTIPGVPGTPGTPTTPSTPGPSGIPAFPTPSPSGTHA